MASNEVTGHQQQFVEEIDYNEIQKEEVVGKGSFGVVWKGRWRGRDVAVKHINSEGERKAFTIEVRQLSRVSHPNIVKLYGACTKNPVCLVMEYAEGGSLYNVLHCSPQPHYTAGHAISWALQCARGVAYLHNMKPKPLIHRDLKPPNLLLILGGQTLKICDFGTACDLNTYMTNNKGSAAWMAPEVFEGSRYTEKCDVFSWGIILWEVLSRKKPFDDIGGSAYRIMWAVHTGKRPPLIEGCPRPIEDLMTRCWKKIPEQRPSMNEVVAKMTTISEFFPSDLEPVEYSTSNEDSEEAQDIYDDTLDIPSTLDSHLNGSSVTNGTIRSCLFEPTGSKDLTAAGIDHHNNINIKPQSYPTERIDEGYCNEDVRVIPQAESQSTDAKVRNWNSRMPTQLQSPKFTEPTSEKTSEKNQAWAPLSIECGQNAWDLDSSLDSTSWELRNMPGFDKMAPKKKTLPCSSTTNEDLDNVYRLLDTELRPITPDYSCERSLEIFEEHKQLAKEYLKVQTEIALLGQHKNEICKNLSPDTIRHQQELAKLEDEKESLIKLHRNLKRQLEIIKAQRSLSNATITAPTMVSGEDGWVVVPRQDASSSRLS